MSVDSWFEGFLEEGPLANLIQYLNGSVYSNGTKIPPALPYAWADFISIIDWTQYDGVFFRVTDKHSVGSTGGSYWWADGSGDRPILLSGPIQVTTLALAYSTFPPLTYPGLKVLPADVGSVMTAVGTEYLLDSGECTLSRSAVAKRTVSPAVTFTLSGTAVTDDGSGRAKITAGGAHGLTNAVIGASGNTHIPISGGTGWTQGLYPIHSIDSDTSGVVITLTTAFASQGNPTIALAGTEFVLQKVTVPKMTVNGYLMVDWTWGSTSGVGTKLPAVRLGNTGAGLSGTAFYLPAALGATNLGGRIVPIYIQNRAATNIQVGSYYAPSNAGGGALMTSGGPTTGAIETSVPTELVMTAKMASANDPIWIDREITRYGT